MHLVWFDTKEELEQMEEILGVKFTQIKQRVAGMTAADIPTVAEKAAQASSMKGNPIALTIDEMQDILRQAL